MEDILCKVTFNAMFVQSYLKVDQDQQAVDSFVTLCIPWSVLSL